MKKQNTSIAKYISEIVPGYTRQLEFADKMASSTDQNYNNESTTFTFTDGSVLIFSSADYSVTEI